MKSACEKPKASLPLLFSAAKVGLVESVYITEGNEENEEEMMHPLFEKADMKLLNVPVGLLVNFHELTLVDGLHRLMLPGANT